MMAQFMHKNRSVSPGHFAMTARPDIPRSAFQIQKAHKTTFDAGYLVPIYVDEVLPGDTFNVKMTAFTRLSTPLFPLMDNLHLETFFFFVPNRLVWKNWVRMMGEQVNIQDSIDYTVPQITSPVGGWAVGSLGDHFGLPTVGQVAAGKTITTSALWFRAYSLIWNEWFRDENLQNPLTMDRDSDGPDDPANVFVMHRGKRADYFTTCLPWPQKGQAVTIPMSSTGTAPVDGASDKTPMFAAGNGFGFLQVAASTGQVTLSTPPSTSGQPLTWDMPKLYANLSESSAATINQLRQAFQVQKLLERDARGGTRYTEILTSHFGVRSPDARLQRPEYLGGGYSPVMISPVAQTSGTPQSGDGPPLGTLGGTGAALANGHGFTQSFVEHGVIIGLACVRADLSYQQGIRRMWSRKTRYDFYWPAFAALGEQAVLSKEIFADGNAGDEGVFGYQERWAEYRYQPSTISSVFRSTSAGTLDAWHLAQHYTSRPDLWAGWIEENPPVDRVIAVPGGSSHTQFLFDAFFDMRVVRPLPLYSVPGLVDHF